MTGPRLPRLPIETDLLSFARRLEFQLRWSEDSLRSSLDLSDGELPTIADELGVSSSIEVMPALPDENPQNSTSFLDADQTRMLVIQSGLDRARRVVAAVFYGEEDPSALSSQVRSLKDLAAADKPGAAVSAPPKPVEVTIGELPTFYPVSTSNKTYVLRLTGKGDYVAAVIRFLEKFQGGIVLAAVKYHQKHLVGLKEGATVTVLAMSGRPKQNITSLKVVSDGEVVMSGQCWDSNHLDTAVGGDNPEEFHYRIFYEPEMSVRRITSSGDDSDTAGKKPVKKNPLKKGQAKEAFERVVGFYVEGDEDNPYLVDSDGVVVEDTKYNFFDPLLLVLTTKFTEECDDLKSLEGALDALKMDRFLKKPPEVIAEREKEVLRLFRRHRQRIINGASFFGLELPNARGGYIPGSFPERDLRRLKGVSASAAAPEPVPAPDPTPDPVLPPAPTPASAQVAAPASAVSPVSVPEPTLTSDMSLIEEYLDEPAAENEAKAKEAVERVGENLALIVLGLNENGIAELTAAYPVEDLDRVVRILDYVNQITGYKFCAEDRDGKLEIASDFEIFNVDDLGYFFEGVDVKREYRGFVDSIQEGLPRKMIISMVIDFIFQYLSNHKSANVSDVEVRFNFYKELLQGILKTADEMKLDPEERSEFVIEALYRYNNRYGRRLLQASGVRKFLYDLVSERMVR